MVRVADGSGILDRSVARGVEQMTGSRLTVVDMVGGGEQGPRWQDDQRGSRSAAVKGWCARSTVPGPAADLSDLAALCVAAGRAGDAVREVLTVRARNAVGVPVIGDYTGLRNDAVRLRDLEAGGAGAPGGAREMWRSRRADLLRRRLGATRSRIASSLIVHGGGVRGVRRERREGIHLTLDQREHVFALLCWTPAPRPERRGGAAGFGQAAVADLVELAAGGWDAARRARGGGPPQSGGRVPAALRHAGRWAGPVPPAAEAPPAAVFADAYETLVYLCGRYFDRIRLSEAWNSDGFLPHRTQADLVGELVELSRDTAELQSLAAELEAARATADGRRAHRGIDARSRALRPVWDQLVDRTVSFAGIAEAMDHLDAGIRSENAALRAESLDARIDGLVGRAGGHAYLTAGLHRIGEEAESGAWSALGYRTQVEREIEELTAARRR